MSGVFTLSDLSRGGKRKAGATRLTQWKKQNRPKEDKKKIRRTIRNGVLVVETDSESESSSADQVKQEQKKRGKKRTKAESESEAEAEEEEKMSSQSENKSGSASGSSKRKSAKPRRHVSRPQEGSDEESPEPNAKRNAQHDRDEKVGEITMEELETLDADELEKRFETARRMNMDQRYENTMKKHREQLENIQAIEETQEERVKGISRWQIPRSLERDLGLPVGSNGFYGFPPARSIAMTSIVRQHCYESRESTTISAKCQKSEQNSGSGGKCKITGKDFEKWRGKVEKDGNQSQPNKNQAAAEAIDEEEEIRLAIELSINEARQKAGMEPIPVSAASAKPALDEDRPREIMLSDSEEDEKRPAKSSSPVKANAKADSQSAGSYPVFHCPKCDSIAFALIGAKYKFFDGQSYNESVIYLPYPQLEALSIAYYDQFGASGFKKSELSQNSAILLWNYYKRYGTISKALSEIFGQREENDGVERKFEAWKIYEEEFIHAWNLAGKNKF